MKKLSNKFRFGIIAILAGACASLALATPITGQANIAGNVNVSGTSITFMPTFTSTNGALETGDFSGLQGGSIQSLSGGPVTGNTFVSNFIVFTTGLATPIHFDLTYVAPGVGTLANCSSSAPGAACTPAGSPFSLFQLSSNTVIASLQLNGVSYLGTAASGYSQTVSIFSTQTVFGGTIPAVVAQLQNGGSINGITYSASFDASSPVPEPISLLLIGSGLVTVSLFARRQPKVE